MKREIETSFSHTGSDGNILIAQQDRENSEPKRLRKRKKLMTTNNEAIKDVTNLCKILHLSPSSSENNKETSKSYICPFCTFKKSTKDSLMKHINFAHARKPKACPYCFMLVVGMADLKIHISANHYELLIFKCKECDYRSAKNRNLANHIKTVHRKEKSFRCKKCDHETTSKQNLKLHEAAIHSKIRPYQCPFDDCSYSSAVSSSLKTHIMGKHEKLKPYKCPECQYRATQSATLRGHISAVHARHECPLCNFKADCLVELGLHMKESHSSANTEANKADAVSSSCNPTKWKVEQCPDCDLTFDKFEDLQDHFIDAHLDHLFSIPEWHRCSICMYGSESYEAVSKHIVSQHREEYLNCYNNCLSRSELPTQEKGLMLSSTERYT